MSDAHDAIVWRRVSTGLLALLVVGTLLLVGTVGFEWIRRQNEETQELVGRVGRELRAAERHLERADEIVRRFLRLESRRVRLAVLVELCTVFRLEGQKIDRCRLVSERTRELVQVIRDFRERLRSPPAPASSGGTKTQPPQTSTITTAAPPDNVGNSDQCPPRNPGC